MHPTPQASALLPVKPSFYYRCRRASGRLKRAQTCRLREQCHNWHPRSRYGNGCSAKPFGEGGERNRIGEEGVS